MMTVLQKDRCQGRVYHGRMGFMQCSRRAIRDGYCASHHPENKEQRRSKSDARHEKQRSYWKWLQQRKDLRADIADAAIEGKPIDHLVAKYKKHIKAMPEKIDLPLWMTR